MTYRRRLGALPLVAAVVFSGAGVMTADRGAAKAAEPLAGPYMLNPAPDGVTVCWLSDRECVGRVRWRAEGADRWNEVGEGARTRFHAVRVTGLSPDTEHRVEALSGDSPAGALAYRSPPAPGEAPDAGMTFFVYGDSQARPAVHEEVSAGILAEAERLKQHTFVLHVGDFTSNSDTSSEAEWSRQFFRPAAAMLRRLPLLPVRGNHEEVAKMFRRFFPEPGPPVALPDGCDYVLSYGPLRVLVLDQFVRGSASEAHLRWAMNSISEPGVRWRFAAFHEPIYSVGVHGSNTTYRGCVEPTLVAGRVHAVFSGHDHDYQRIKPMMGVTYFVSGGGGGTLSGKSAPPPEWLAKFRRDHNFLAVTVGAGKATVRALHAPKHGGVAFDEFDSVDIPLDCGWPVAGNGALPASPAAFPWRIGVAATVCLAAGLTVLYACRISRRRSGQSSVLPR